MAELVVIDVPAATAFLRRMNPDLEWLLGQIESEKGYLRFPRVLSDAITNLKIECYPLLYENEAAIGSIFIVGLIPAEELAAINWELENATPAERGEWLGQMLDSLSEGIEGFEIPKSAAQIEASRKQFDAMSPTEQKEAVVLAQRLYMGLLASFFQLLSVMVHGEKMTALVAKAKARDDDALCKAVQIDKRVLTTIPYFKARFMQATAECDQGFLDVLAYRLRCPPYRGKIRHKALWLAFAFLDMCGLLQTLRHQQLLNLLDDAGLGGFANRIEDVKHLTKRLADYRRLRTDASRLSTP